MKPIRSFFADARRHKGLALIIVLSMLALATIVILAFLSVADTEHKATITYSASQGARRLADSAVNMVIANIRAASDQDTTFAGREFHATQPGAVRKYTQHGAFLAGYKLFSDKNMVFRGGGTPGGTTSVVQERTFVAESEPPGDWNRGNNLARYVDLNEPVVKGVADDNGNTTSVQTYFPIIDPRAAMDMDPGTGVPIPVEGFSYSETVALRTSNNNLAQPGTTGGDSPLVVPTTGMNPDRLRLAMPVQWLYVLKDGTIGYLNDNLEFEGGETEPSESNPIIGRVAFWTDDETCKININTASEPTHIGQPIYYHERDHRWGDYPAARSEYQRFPGHPATVALSSVLYPNPMQDVSRSLETYGRSAGDLDRILSVKDKIYEIMPRIHTGGSQGGTRVFDVDDFNNGRDGKSEEVAINLAANERLYASVDELLFSQLASGERRVLNDTSIQGGNLFNKQTIERASAFLTASSRASEISLLGLPRIAMWPISTSPAKRTGFDNLIEFCSTVGAPGGANTYVFQRQNARHTTEDVNIARNRRLLDMLDRVLGNAVFPAATETGGVGTTFKSKMKSANGFENYRQVIVQMFDYIRATNLYDSYLVEPNRGSWPTASIYWGNNVNSPNALTLYDVRDTMDSNNTFKTYTPGIVRNISGANSQNPFADVALPGHGQVTPAEWSVGGKIYRGFGRNISISEIGLHFICTADGQPDMYSWRIPQKEDDPSTPNVVEWKIPEVALENYDGTQQPSRAALEAMTGDGTVTGGRTALRVRDSQDDFFIEHVLPTGWEGEAVLTNTVAQFWNGGAQGQTAPEMIKDRYYSNYPPLSDPSVADELYNTTPQRVVDYARFRSYHPGARYQNWNWTLEQDVPLAINQKRVQALLQFEFFCPSVGYPKIVPEFTLVLNGTQLTSIEVDGKSIFRTSGNVVLKSGLPLFNGTTDSSPEVGGYASFNKVANGRVVGGRDKMPDDPGYNGSATGNVHQGLVNLDLVSSYFTVTSDVPMNFSSGTIEVDVYDTHDWQRDEPIQRIFFQLKAGQCPAPDLIVVPSHREFWVRESDGAEFNHPTVQAPRWWTFHRGGALGRYTEAGDAVDVMNNADYISRRGRLLNVPGLVNLSGATARNGNTGRQSVPGASSLIYGYEETNNFRHVKRHDNRLSTDQVRQSRIAYDPAFNYNKVLKHSGSDTIRSLQPGHGDARIIFAKKRVEATDWTPHILWDNPNAFLAHNFSNYTANDEPGFDRRGDINAQSDQLDRRVLPAFVNLTNTNPPTAGTQAPDAPFNGPATQVSPFPSAARLAQRYFDFDDTDPGGRVGTFINKPDEGNFSVGEFKESAWPTAVTWRSTYFRSNSFGARFAAGSRSFFTPNRMISSPVMMGSLPSRVHFSNPIGMDPNNGGNGAWTNLLFRPHVQYGGSAQGNPNGSVTGASLPSHPGQASPPDHYLLDLFWMPVVEPYAISEPLSTAGKINMNYQILPFTHIRRATAMHAAMKGELFASLPNADYSASRGLKAGFGVRGASAPIFRSENEENKYWHHYIAVDRFNNENGNSDQPWYATAAGQRVQATLRQFEERFNFTDQASPNGPSGIGGAQVTFGSFRQGLFRSPSQICEIHLIPSRVKGPNTGNVPADSVDSFNDRKDAMGLFWQNHASTGDNTRERPYASLYAKLTTRSNTFRVHVRAQMLKKVIRGQNNIAGRFDLTKDQVAAEFRGSFLLERYIDRADMIAAGSKVDFTDGDPLDISAHPPLDTYYRYRVLESKRFAP